MTRAGYRSRVVDGELADLLRGLPAVLIEGPKAVGKTAAARQVCADEVLLDDPAIATVARADPAVLLSGRRHPLLVDEWHLVGSVFDAVRRKVDLDHRAGRFVLTGSARPEGVAAHTGAGRVVTVRMRPMTMPERGVTNPTVPFSALVEGGSSRVGGGTAFDLAGYAREIGASGFPAIRALPARYRPPLLDGYIESVIQRDIAEAGHRVRKPETLRCWLEAFAAATATPTSLDKIRNTALRGDGSVPTKQTVLNYHNALRRLWVVEDVPGWSPSSSRFTTLNQAPKHHLADPALVLSLLGMDHSALLRDGPLFGRLFESLSTLTVRVFSQPTGARVRHLRTRGGRQEVDLVVERRDGRILAMEAKLSRHINDHDVAQLLWLRSRLGSRWMDGAVLNTGPVAYRRPDGIAVIPLALLGP